MTPILEGLDGVQKMSKSLNNAIGINEPPRMYGKLMSISDQLMWSYWLLSPTFASPSRRHESEVAAGNMHPMATKKLLARTIARRFPRRSRRIAADENWAACSSKKKPPKTSKKSPSLTPT